MGGLGSGNWYRADSKRIVEESLTLAVANIQNAHGVGVLTWTSSRGPKYSVKYVGAESPDRRNVLLLYRWADKEDV